MAKHDLLFLLVTVLLMTVTLAAFKPASSETFSGHGSLEPANVPYIKLLGPDRNTELFSPHQTFVYEVKNVDYEVVCQLLVNDKAQSYDLVKPGDGVRVTTKLSEGRYKWAVQCKLMNSRTISSVENTVNVNSYKDLGRTQQVTGRVIAVPEHDAKQSYVIAMVLILFLVGVMNLRLKSQ